MIQWTRKKACQSGADLREGVVIVQSNPQRLDTDFPLAVSTFPYICKAAKGDRFVTDSGEITGYGVRRWEGHVIATDGLQSAQTLSGNIVGGGNGTEGLWSSFRNQAKGRNGVTHFVEEIHQPSQL